MEHGEEKHELIPYKVFVLVWLALVVLTLITVSAAQMNIGNWSVLIALIVTPLKSMLVLLYFMHLKYEADVFKYMFLVAIVVLAIVIGITFVDYSFR